MQTLFYILVIMACLAVLANTIILVFLAIAVVNLRDKLREFFSDLVNMLAVPDAIPTNDYKTWDQKYEEELIERERQRIREKDELDRLSPPV